MHTGMPGQPAVAQWMTRPEGIPGCPPGLEYLCQIDQLLVKQQMELLEGIHIFIGYQTFAAVLFFVWCISCIRGIICYCLQKK